VTGNVHGRDLTAAQHRAVSVLLATGSAVKAAEAAGISERTLRRWRHDDQFLEALRDAGRRNAGEAMSHLLGAQLEAVEALRQAIRSGSPAVKVRAGRALLELGLKISDDDLGQRLERLEGVWRGGLGQSESQHLRIVQPSC
jgi:hypothetical protein